MKVRCRKCGRIENAILTTLAAAVNACDLDGRWIWEPGAPVPEGWDVVVEEKEAVGVGHGS